MSLTPALSEALALFGQKGAFCKGLIKRIGTDYSLSLKGAFFYLCQAVSGIDFISISQPSVNKAECLIYSRYRYSGMERSC